MFLTENLVQGVDVWLNTPRRPWEASETSGMKVLVDSGINLSELNGWWAEAYTPEVGWAVGDEQQHGDDPDWHAAEAETLYNLLEQQVISEFYTRNQTGVPERFVERMRKSMSTLTLRFQPIVLFVNTQKNITCLWLPTILKGRRKKELLGKNQ